MARPRKTLVELVRDNTFRRDRHKELLLRETLPREKPDWVSPKMWGHLRFAQERFQSYSGKKGGTNPGMAYDYLDAFSRCVRALHGGKLPWLLGGD